MTGAEHALIGRHDALLLDLDGTLLLAGQAIPHAPESLQRAREFGVRTVFVTNNAARSPAQVAERLSAAGMPSQAPDVVSSPSAAAQLLQAAHRPGAKVLIIGTAALAEAIADAGLTPVRSAAAEPVAVVQGHSPETGWQDLAEACIALRAGADWVATNTDVTLPTDRGLLPGNGAMVRALVAATGRQPRVAGKPARPLLDTAVQLAASKTPLVVGDRLETDIAAAVAAGLPSLMVLTGASSTADVLRASPGHRPTVVSADLRGLFDPAACVRLDQFDDDEALKAALARLGPV